MCVQHALPFSLFEGPYCLLCKANYAADAAGYCEPCDSAAAKTAFAVNLAILVLMALGAFALYKCYRKFKKLASKKVKTAVKVGLLSRGDSWGLVVFRIDRRLGKPLGGCRSPPTLLCSALFCLNLLLLLQIVFCLVQVLAALSQAFSLNFPPVFDAFLVGLTAMSFDINSEMLSAWSLRCC